MKKICPVLFLALLILSAINSSAGPQNRDVFREQPVFENPSFELRNSTPGKQQNSDIEKPIFEQPQFQKDKIARPSFENATFEKPIFDKTSLQREGVGPVKVPKNPETTKEFVASPRKSRERWIRIKSDSRTFVAPIHRLDNGRTPPFK